MRGTARASASSRPPLPRCRNEGRVAAMRLLFIADIFGRPGREAVESLVPRLREELDLDLVVANGENAADGAGITDRLADRILASGVDCITLGNHTWHQRGFGAYLDREPRIVRPANYLASNPGRGSTVVEARDGTPRRRRQPDGAPVRPSRAGLQPVRAGGLDRRRGQGAGSRRARRHACRGDQREGRDGPAPGRAGSRRCSARTRTCRPTTPRSGTAPPTSPTAA